MFKIALTIMLIIAVATLSWGEMKEKYFPSDPLDGASLFTEKGCDRCHAVEGHGGSFGPDLASSEFNRSLLDIVSLMWNHSPQMISMMNDLRVVSPTLTGDQLAELAAYLFYIDYFDKPGDIAEGQRVFSRKGCDNCHRVAGIGTRIGPALAHIRKYVSPIFLAQEMWDHGPQIKSKMDDLGVQWPEFEGEEISDLLAFLRDASQDTTSVRIFMRPGNPQIGEKLFTAKKCSTCHRVGGTGTTIGPDLTKSEFHKSVTSVAAMMWNHGPSIWQAMDEIGVKTPTFENNEMADLIAYLYFLRFQEKKTDPDRGEMLFNQKGCQKCHHFGEQEVNGSVSLSEYKSDGAEIDIAAELWNDAAKMAAKITQKKLEWPRLYDGELHDIIGYIQQQNRR